MMLLSLPRPLRVCKVDAAAIVVVCLLCSVSSVRNVSSLPTVELGGVTGTKGGFAISGFLTDTKLLFYLDVRSCIYVSPSLV